MKAYAKELGERCQRKPGVQRRPHSRFLLSELLRCAHCHYSMGGFTCGGAKGQTPVYRCSRGRNGACGEPSVITAGALEAFACSTVVEYVRGLKLEAARNGTDLVYGARKMEAR